jgi:hypothetical protein
MAEKKKGWLYNTFLFVMILGMGGWLAYQYAPIPESVRTRVGALLGQSPDASSDGEAEADAALDEEAAVGDEATSGTATTRVAKKPSPTPAPTPKSRVVADNQFSNINKLNIFDPLYTPTPTPTPKPPEAVKPPDLEKALRDWKFEYALKKKTVWHFVNKRVKDQAYDVEIGKTFTLQDGGRPFDVNIVADGKYGMAFVYPGPPEQRKAFSMLDPQ